MALTAGYYVAGYSLRDDVHPSRDVRVCLMDDHTAAIRAGGGRWSEVEIADDRAVVTVEAGPETLDMLDGEFTRLADLAAAEALIAAEPR